MTLIMLRETLLSSNRFTHSLILRPRACIMNQRRFHRLYKKPKGNPQISHSTSKMLTDHQPCRWWFKHPKNHYNLGPPTQARAYPAYSSIRLEASNKLCPHLPLRAWAIPRRCLLSTSQTRIVNLCYRYKTTSSMQVTQVVPTLTP
jgi:hypothetical protein